MEEKHMTKEELAAQLNGMSYRAEPPEALRDAAWEHKLVIVYGASDDLLELRGALSEEYGAGDGETFLLTTDGVFDNDACIDQCIYYREAKQKAEQEGSRLTALWCQEEPYSWTYRTTIPHATFDMVEEGQPYCRGIVFALADIGGAQAEAPPSKIGWLGTSGTDMEMHDY
jgi:hypothetical protein